jgi:hypothetical protein
MAKSNWLKHVTNTYKLLKQSNPEAKLKDAMRLASKTFKKVSSVVRDYIPEKKGKKTFVHTGSMININMLKSLIPS